MANDMENKGNIELIRELFAYAEKFRGSTFVIRISNEVIDHPQLSQHALDISLLHKANIRVVIVAGAQLRIDEVLDRFDLDTATVHGLRLATPQSIDLIKMAAFDCAQKIMTALSGHKITAVIGNWVRARSRGVRDGVDFQCAGEVDNINIEALTRSLEQGHIPIFPCIGHNESGDPFNLSSDEIAIKLASELNVSKLLIISAMDVLTKSQCQLSPGVGSLDDGRIFKIEAGAVKEFIKKNSHLEIRDMLEMAAKACQIGVERVQIMDGRNSGEILREIFSSLGSGTMIYNNEYEHLRAMVNSDIDAVLEIMAPLASEGILLRRSRKDMEEDIKDYIVYDTDGVVHGCAALHSLGNGISEIAAVAVDPRFSQLGIGSRLISHLLEMALEKGHKKVVALSTRSVDWFLSQGFVMGSLADLPPERQKKYPIKRNSKIVVRNIDSKA